MNSGSLISNRYRVESFLGQGGFGRTYLVSDMQRFREACVLKEFVPGNLEKDILHKSYELFEREARVLYSIDHPQIPKFISWFREQEKVFIVQEYIEGKTYSETLRERLSQTGKAFSEDEVTQWLWDMLPVLDYIHKRNLIHRDISLENVMLSASQLKPVLIDFGLVKEKVSRILSVNSSQAAEAGTVVGKFGYAPLEQIRRGECYPCSDIYTLGVCALTLLTGKTPNLLLNENFDWKWRSYVKVSDSLASILDKMLAEKPADRYQSASEVLVELEFPNASYTSSSGIIATNSIATLEINLDQGKREHEFNNVVETNDFKLLEQLANNFRDKTQTQTSTVPPLKVQESSDIPVTGKLPLDDSKKTSLIKSQNQSLKSEVINSSEPKPSQNLKQPIEISKHYIEEKPKKALTVFDRVRNRILISLGIFGLSFGIGVFMSDVRLSANQGEVLKDLKSVCPDIILPSQLQPEPKTEGIKKPGNRTYYGFPDRNNLTGKGMVVENLGNGDKRRFDGKVKDGSFNGCGTQKISNQQFYIGQFSNDLYDGFGILRDFKQNEIVIGTFKRHYPQNQNCQRKDPSVLYGFWQDIKSEKSTEIEVWICD